MTYTLVTYFQISVNAPVLGSGDIPGVLPALLGLVHGLAPKVNDEGAKHFFLTAVILFSARMGDHLLTTVIKSTRCS